MTALATATPTSLADKPGHWTRGHAVEVKLCKQDFLRWCERWAKIEDKETHRAIPFALYRCQEKLGGWLVGRKWLRILKARRLGVTWLLAAFSVWLVTLHQMQTVGYIVHKAPFAYDFLKRCRFIYKRLPWFLKSEITQDTKEIIEFDQAGQGCWIRAFAATPGAADSVAADMVIVDEATKIEKLNPGLLRDILRSAEPTVETSNGSVILCGTSEGPQGEFHRGWQAEQDGKGRYGNVFWSWQERPGRGRKWYEQMAAKHKSDPLFMPRQYPNSAEEAFAHAEGRIYPRFAENTHVCRFDRQDRLVWAADQWEALGDVPVNSAWLKWRSIDWGGRDPFVCLWVCKIPGNRSALTVDPSCRNLIREMMAYRRKSDSDYIEDKDNHACFPAGTPIETINGPVPIEAIRQGDVVRSHLGWARVDVGATCTGIKPLLRLTLSDMRCIICTPEHPLARYGGGWIAANQSLGAAVSVCREKASPDHPGSRRTLLSSTGFASPATRNRRTGPIGCTSRRDSTTGGVASAGSMRKSGSSTGAQFPPASTFTIRTETRSTTALPTWNVSPMQSTPGAIRATRRRLRLRWRKQGRQQKPGTGARSGENGTASTPQTFTPRANRSSSDAPFAANCSALRTRNGRHDSAQTDARLKPEGILAQTTSGAPAVCVGRSLASIATRRRSTARVRVQPAYVAAIEALPGVKSVYDIATSDGTMFANGVLAMQCDALRYAVVTFNLHGHVHVYRELYEPDHATRGLALPALAEKIHELTGDEEIRASVADRSRTDNILLMKQQLEALTKTRVKVPVIPHTKPSAAPDKTRHEVEQGIDRVNILIVGTHDMFPVRPRDPVEVAWEEMQSDPCPSGVGTTMQHHRRTKQVTARVKHRIAQLRGPSRRRRRRLALK